MKLPPFAYRAPVSVDEVLSLLAEHGDEARVLAGGQSLLPLLAFRLARPSVLIDLNRVEGLAAIEDRGSDLSFGAMVRERAAERSDLVQERLPLLAEALPLIGHAAIRNRGTIGGSLAHCDPAAELPAVALASSAVLIAESAARGERAIPADEAFLGHFTTALEPDELLTSVRLPFVGPATGVSFVEVARRHGDFAMVGVAATVRLDQPGGDRIVDARLALIGMASTPVRPRPAEELLAGAQPTRAAVEEAAELAVRELDPPDDLHASSAYRRRVAAVLVRRALEQASQRAAKAA